MTSKINREIHSVGLITKRNVAEHSDLLQKLVRYLKRNKKEVFFDNNSGPLFDDKGHKKEWLIGHCDMVIVMGGDGTILKSARRLAKKRTLVLGVNLGTLGFLTETTPEKLFETLKKVFSGQFDIDRRSVLRVTIYRDNQKVSTYLALNDAAINQGAFARLIKLNLEIDGRQVAKIKADGLIVSTPTGSTAHSLSAGGPIVHPKIDGLVITPICPSALSMRPIVVPDNRQMTITIETERQEESAIIGLTLDGQDMTILKFGDKIKIRRSSRSFYFIRTGNRYYRMLRNKLHWGH